MRTTLEYAVIMFCLSLASVESSAAKRTEAMIVTHIVTGPSIGEGGQSITFVPAEAVRVVETKGSLALVEDWSRGGGRWGRSTWIPKKYLADASLFHPMPAWRGEKRFVANAGDYQATYYFNSDGTFKIVEVNSVNDNSYVGYHYVDVRYQGHLFRAGNVVWARFEKKGYENLGSKSKYMFRLKPNGKLCHPSSEGCDDP